MRGILGSLVLTVAAAVAGCASPPQPPAPGAQIPRLPDDVSARLVGRWQDEVCKYLAREGDGNPAAIGEAKALRSSDSLRPARVTFGVLDVDAESPGRNGWDVQGVLVGRQGGSGGERYFFLVGVLSRYGYVPTGLQDIRLVGLSAQGGRLTWEVGTPTPEAVQRYRETFPNFAARFPADTDSFAMVVAGQRVTVREQRSGAEWFLEERPRAPSQAHVIPILRNTASADRCSGARS